MHMLKWIAGAVIACGVHGSLLARAQAPAVSATYDVATIKPHTAGELNSMWRYQGAGFVAKNIALRSLIAVAYGVKPTLILGLPAWAEAARYDMQGKSSDLDPQVKQITPEQWHTMLGAFLAERFGLRAHVEQRVQPVFELTVVPSGVKMQESQVPAATEDDPKPQRKVSWEMGSGHMSAQGTKMDVLVTNLTYLVDRVVIDKTGLIGLYDLAMTWTPEDMQASAKENGVTADAPPNVFTALKEQLGLQLKSAKGPVPTVVVDRVEPPKDN